MKNNTKKYSIIFYSSIALCFIIMIFMIFTNTQKRDLTSTNGVLDMRECTFDASTCYSLGRAFAESTATFTRDYDVYSLVVILPDDVDVISLLLPAISTNYRLDINNVIVYEQDKNKMLYPRNEIITYKADSSLLYLKLYVDSERKIDSPITNPAKTSELIIGTPTSVHASNHINNLLSTIILIICISSSVFHLLLFLARNYSKTHLYFCLLSFSVALSFLFIKSSIIRFYLPDLSMFMGYKISVQANCLRTFGVIGAVKELFSEYKSQKMFKGLFIVCLILSIIALFASQQLIALLMITFNGLFTLSTVLAMILIIKNKIYCKDNDSFLYSIGFIILLFGAFSDLLYTYSLTAVNSMVAYCMIMFIIFQSVIISNNYYKSIKNVTHLSNDLKATVFELQNNKSTFISTHIKPEFLYTVLDSISDSCGNDNEKTDKLIQALAKYLRQSLDFNSDQNQYSLKTELELCEAYAILIADQHPEIKINIEYEKNIPNASFIQLGILSLIENSVEYAFEGVLQPKINISAVHDEISGKILITVSDNGRGLSAEEIEYAISIPNKHLSIGLYYINQYLLDTEEKGLDIISVPRKGTTISFILTPNISEERNVFY